MNHRTRLALCAVAAAATVILSAPSAHAWTAIKWCNGNPTIWGNFYFQTTNTYSYPSGAAQTGALSNAVGQWQRHTNYINWEGTEYTTNVIHGNSVSETFLASASALGTNVFGNTWTTYSTNCTFWFDNQVIGEADVAALDSLQFGDPDESGWLTTNGTNSDGGGRSVLMHEFGHAIGLDHYFVFNNMRTGLPKPFIGGTDSHVQVLPDDALGARALYSYQPATLQNLQASAQMLSGGSIVNTAFKGTISLCHGNTFNMSFTVTNPGSTNLTFDQKFYLASSPNAYFGGTQFGVWNGGTVNAYSAVTWSNVSFAIPFGVPPGVYWVVHFVDPNNAISETYKNDNFVHNVLTIRVLSC